MSMELREIVHGYASKIEAAVEGTLYRVDGENVVINDLDEWREKEYEKRKSGFLSDHSFERNADRELYKTEQEWIEGEIGTADDIEDPDSVPLWEYIGDVSLGDMVFEVDQKKSLRGGRTLVAFGGPNIWIHDDCVKGYWGGVEWTTGLSVDARDELFQHFDEAWRAIDD